MTNTPVYVLALAAVLCTSAVAQFVYPAKGQTPQQQKSDEAACQTWAVQQSGYDPSKPPPPSAKPPTTATGTTPGAGMRGAAKGAVVAEVADGDAGKGAAIGAVAGRSKSRRQNAAAAAQPAANPGQDAFARARAACLEGRGYTLK
jgi:hypothetical protein